MGEGKEAGEKALSEGQRLFLDGYYEKALEALSEAQGIFYDAEAIDDAGLACALEGLVRKTMDASNPAFVFEDEDGESVDPEELPDAVIVAVANGLVTLASEMGEQVDFELLQEAALDLEGIAGQGFAHDHPAIKYIGDVKTQLKDLSEVDHGVIDEALSLKLQEHMKGIFPEDVVTNFEIRRFENGECFVGMEWLREPLAEESERLQSRLTAFLESVDS